MGEQTWQVLESPLFERAYLDITASVFACITQQLWEEVFRPLEQSECDYPQEHLQQHQSEEQERQRQGQKPHPGSPNSPMELGSPDSSPDHKEEEGAGGTNTNTKQKDNKKRVAASAQHQFRDASIPLAKLLPKIKAVAFK